MDSLKTVAVALWLALGFSLAMLLIEASGAEAQLFAPGGAVFPSPAPRQYVDEPGIAQCVVAKPCPQGDCVILLPCPPGTVVPSPPQPTHPIAQPPVYPAQPLPTPPPEVTPPMVCPACPACPVCPVPTPQAAPRAAPKAVPKKLCPCP